MRSAGRHIVGGVFMAMAAACWATGAAHAHGEAGGLWEAPAQHGQPADRAMRPGSAVRVVITAGEPEDVRPQELWPHGERRSEEARHLFRDQHQYHHPRSMRQGRAHSRRYSQIIVGDSGWRGGGGSPRRYCAQMFRKAMKERGVIGPRQKVDVVWNRRHGRFILKAADSWGPVRHVRAVVLDSGERGRWVFPRKRQYRYSCKIDLQWRPAHSARRHW